MASYSGLDKYAFVSYSHRNARTVVDVINRLSSMGARIWYDEGLEPSDEYLEVIAEKIEKSSFFIAFISRNSLESRYCRDEIRYAYERGKRIMSIYLEDVELSAGQKMILNGEQSCTLHEVKREIIDSIAGKLPPEIVNDSGRILHSNEEYTYFFLPKSSGCGYTVTRLAKSTGKSELILSEGFPPCSEFVIDGISAKRRYGSNFTLTVTVTWDFTYTRSGHDDDYYEETYEYVFYNTASERCGVEKNTLERHDINTGETTVYNYVKGVNSHLDRSNKLTGISGLDAYGNYWSVTGKIKPEEN